MSHAHNMDIPALYQHFQAPIATFDCGQHCAPYNERGVPFCCDVRHTIPTAYAEEWQYLQEHTDLWHRYGRRPGEVFQQLKAELPSGQVLIACQGHEHCQREYRAITCRSFPFFPYLNRQGEFLGLSYYWEYEDRCWVISNLEMVTPIYRGQFIEAYDRLFEDMPGEKENYRHFSITMRRSFGQRGRSIPLLHRNGHTYKVTPGNGRLRRVPAAALQKYGPYKLAAEMPFPEEYVAPELGKTITRNPSQQ